MGKTKKKYILPNVIPNTVRVYTDGSAITKHGAPGGWGVYITDGKGLETGYKGNDMGTTISRMEMEAMRVALDFAIQFYPQDKRRIMIYSDSQMVVRSINLGWLKGWARENFHQRVNADIWKEIWALLIKVKKEKINLEITHIRGHQKDLSNDHVFGNHVADGLADYKQYT